VKESDSEEVDINKQLKLDEDFGVSEGESIVGITIDGIEGVYVHPKFDDEECAVSVGNSGTSSSSNGDDNPGGGNSGSGNSGGKAEDPTGFNENPFGDCDVCDD